jgi:hypothetical protein
MTKRSFESDGHKDGEFTKKVMQGERKVSVHLLEVGYSGRYWRVGGGGGGLGVRDRSHVGYLRRVYGTSWITFHFQHSTGTATIHFLQVHRDFSLTLYKKGHSDCAIYGMTALGRSNTEILELNPTRGIDICPRFFVVLSCVGRGHETGRSQSQGVLPNDLNIHSLRN